MQSMVFVTWAGIWSAKFVLNLGKRTITLSNKEWLSRLILVEFEQITGYSHFE
jgi:hypothetical protein